MIKKAICLILCLFTLSGIVLSADGKFIVVIDPGHGGSDGGATRGKNKEKDITLAVALGLGQLIEKNHKDVKIVYTRKTDETVVLSQRAQIANKAKGNLYISIHVNATDAKQTAAVGVETYILGLHRSADNLAVAKRENSVIMLEDNYKTKYEGFDPNSPESYIIFEFMASKYMEQSLDLASFVQNEMTSTVKRADRGVRQAGFLVLRDVAMPSILTELGFVNNDTDVSYLASKSGQAALAKAIYDGFKKYKDNFDKKQGKSIASSSSNDQQDEFDIEILDVDSTATATENKNDALEYRIQFLVSSQKLSPKSSLFQGLEPIQSYKDGNIYKYTYGSATSLDEAAKVQTQVRKKFKDAFVVKFQNGQRVK